jgi:2'-5' RNA ligase
MRLFTALDLAPDVVSNIAHFLLAVKPIARIRWTLIENLHITTKFIGEWPESRLDEVKGKLAFAHRPFSVAVEGLGFFPNARAPLTFWAGIARNAELSALAAATESALHELGIARDERPYSPHLTLARISTPVPLNQLPVDPGKAFGAFEVHAFHLYQSRNSVYTKLATFPLRSSKLGSP